MGGRWVGRVFNGVKHRGLVTSYRQRSKGRGALWHVVHDDGDEEDLDEAELLRTVEKDLERYRNGQPPQL